MPDLRRYPGNPELIKNAENTLYNFFPNFFRNLFVYKKSANLRFLFFYINSILGCTLVCLFLSVCFSVTQKFYKNPTEYLNLDLVGLN